MAHGFVYVLGNESMPGIYKIGMTLVHPKERMAQLSAATACPTPFELLAFIGCENPKQVEFAIHASLDQYRVNASREFFKAHPAFIQDELRRYGDQYEDVVWDQPLCAEISYIDRVEWVKWPAKYFLEQCADPIDWTPRTGGFS